MTSSVLTNFFSLPPIFLYSFLHSLSPVFPIKLPRSLYSRSDLAEEVAGITSAKDAVSVGLAKVLLHANIVSGLVGLDVGL